MMGCRPDLIEAVEAQQPVQLLDGTPARFAAVFKATLDLPMRRMLIVKADKIHEIPCVMCEEMGAEYTILASMACEDGEGEFDEEVVWPIHQKHFESSVGDGEEDIHGS
jgi:hypothetical protein